MSKQIYFFEGNPLLNNLSKPFSEIKPENSNQIEISASHISKSQPRLNSFDGKSENNPIFSNINDNNDNKESRIHPTLENSQSNNNNINYEFCLKDKKIILPSQMRENYDFRQFKLLGLGAFGCVFQLKEARSENFHAIKRMEFKDSDDLFNITKEINILYRLLPYGNIVTFKQNYSDMVNSAMYIAMEKGDFSLEEYINQSENGSLSTSILHQIMIDITFALVYSYRESVVHSDIKPGNIIVFVNSQKRSELFNIHNGQPSEENLIFKLNDFGSGTLKISKNDLKLKDHMSYTVLYAAPEVKQAEAKEEEEEELKEKEEKEEDKKESQTQKQKYLNYEKADVFSFGMTLLNCCGIGKDVLAKLNQVEKEDAFEKEINRIMDSLAKKLKYRSELLNVIQGMIKYKKEERFSLQDICSNMKFEVPEAKYPEKKREIRQVHEAIEENEAILPPSNIAQPIEYDFEPIFELIEKKLKEVNQRPFYDHKILERIHNRYKKMSPQKHTPVRMVVKYLDSNEIYYGGFEEGLRHLSGLLIFPDGSIYQGSIIHLLIYKGKYNLR